MDTVTAVEEKVSSIKCEFCGKFAEASQVTKFPPYKWIHIDQHGCLCEHIKSLNDKEFGALSLCVGGKILQPLLKVGG